jgi:hypothetical protein
MGTMRPDRARPGELGSSWSEADRWLGAVLALLGRHLRLKCPLLRKEPQYRGLLHRLATTVLFLGCPTISQQTNRNPEVTRRMRNQSIFLHTRLRGVVAKWWCVEYKSTNL